MQNKTSEKFLKYLIRKCESDIDCEIEIDEEDATSFTKLSYATIRGICQDLYSAGYLSTCTIDIFGKVYVVLSYKGFSYFETKRMENYLYLKELALSKVSDVVISVVVSLITSLLVA